VEILLQILSSDGLILFPLLFPNDHKLYRLGFSG